VKQAIDPLLVDQAKAIRLLALDVDGVLTDGRLYFTDEGQEMKAFNSRDGLGIKTLMQYDIQVALITARRSRLLERRARQLKIEHLYQGRENKLAAYDDLRTKLELDHDQVCYVGDDLLDLPVLRQVGLSVTVPSASAAVRERVHWVTEHQGGMGAVREVCDLLLQAQGKYQQWLDEMLDS